VLRDPEFRRLSNEQTAKEYEAEQARTPVPNTGGIVTTVTPGVNQTTTTQTVDGNFVTTRGSGFDPQAQAVDANQSGFTPARSFSANDVSADDTAAIGQFQVGTADDVPTTFGTDDLDPGLSPYGEEDDPQESQPRSTAAEPLQPSLSPYGEENDFCFRATEKGFGIVVATNTFVFHSKTKSYNPDVRHNLVKSAQQIIYHRYGEKRFQDCVAILERNSALRIIRKAVRELYK
jgi:hypothetical protein